MGTEADKGVGVEEDIVGWLQTHGGRTAHNGGDTQEIRVKGERIFRGKTNSSEQDSPRWKCHKVHLGI